MKMVAEQKKSSPKKRRVTHVRFTKAANGFTAHHELEPPKRKPGQLMAPGGYEPDPKPSVFTDKQALMDHLSGLADQMGGDEQGAPEPGQ